MYPELNYSSDKLDLGSKALLAAALNKENNIYFLDVKNYSKEKRHAEEFLCDIAEYAKQFKENLYTCIAGKKRPCMGCSGRMESVGISNYGKFPGLFWTHTIKIQPKEVAIKIVEQLIEKPSHVSVCKDNVTTVTDYDSGSGSDEEKYEEMSKFTL